MEKKYDELSDSLKRDVVTILSKRMSNENVPFKKHEDVAWIIVNWNPSIILVDGVVSGFSKENQNILNRTVEDRLIFKSSNKG